MQTMSENWNASISADCREVKGKVELYQGSTLLSTFLANDNLLSIDIERNCASGKFFGYSILQQATVKILDTQRALNVAEGQILKCYIGCKVGNSDEYVSFPSFYISSVERDENDNSLTLKGWDIMHQIALKTSSEINLTAPYLLDFFASTGASTLANLLPQASSRMIVPPGTTSFLSPVSSQITCNLVVMFLNLFLALAIFLLLLKFVLFN